MSSNGDICWLFIVVMAVQQLCVFLSALSQSGTAVNRNIISVLLWQVEFLFTDKTGTLTENEMQFRMCSVAGTQYEEVGSMLCALTDTGGQPQPVPVFDVSHRLQVHRSAM